MAGASTEGWHHCWVRHRLFHRSLQDASGSSRVQIPMPVNEVCGQLATTPHAAPTFQQIYYYLVVCYFNLGLFSFSWLSFSMLDHPNRYWHGFYVGWPPCCNLPISPLGLRLALRMNCIFIGMRPCPMNQHKATRKGTSSKPWPYDHQHRA